MDVAELFNGVSVVIDDEVNDPTANIRNILNQIKNQNIPVLTYDAIPSEEVISNFRNLSFVLLDWRLVKNNISTDEFEEGVSIPQTLQTAEARINIDFIKRLKEVCFCPVFIFTNEDKNEIIAALEAEGLYKTTKPNHIFIKSKSEIKGRTKLFAEIRKWIKNNPSVYVLKEWEREYQKSKNKLFSDFHALSSVWPRIMWKNFEDDGVNRSFELGELISRNLHTRMAPFEFSEEILNKKGVKIEKSELRCVLEGERYLKNSCLHTNAISTGDIFKVVDEAANARYFLNIRAQCDLVRSSSLDNVELYCLKGKVITEDDIKSKKGIPFKHGQFIEKVNHAIITFIDDGCILDFSFRDLVIKKWKDLKSKRIGQLLPPHINRIQQRYALYLQRQGLPRTPDIALFGR
ncbi:MAG: hypothetical protein HYV24_06775 [Deltaproteobacteria bacterium]|nr:hypothetical protein [Deltaproteobacteria bacterium]